MFRPITTKLAGVSYGKCQENIKKWGCADIGTYAVVRDRDNPHDPNAVRVSLFGSFDMGFLPRDVARVLAPMMDAGRTFLAEFVSRNEYRSDQWVGLTVRIVETTR